MSDTNKALLSSSIFVILSNRIKLYITFYANDCGFHIRGKTAKRLRLESRQDFVKDTLSKIVIYDIIDKLIWRLSSDRE